MYIEVEAETSNEPADMTFLPLTQLVLDLAILRDARLSWPGSHYQGSLAAKERSLAYLSVPTGSRSRTHDRESQVRLPKRYATDPPVIGQ